MGCWFMLIDAMAAWSKVKKINSNTDINALTLGKMLCFCSQFVDGQASSMVLEEGGMWKVDPERLLGQTERERDGLIGFSFALFS